MPVPEEPRAIFVGVLERYKNVELLAEAWRIVAARLPGARLHLVGTGTQVEVAAASRPGGGRLGSAARAARARCRARRARVLLLPSALGGACAGLRSRRSCAGAAWSARGRAGFPDIVEDGVNGLLVEPGDAVSLAAAIERVLADHGLAVALGEAAAASAADWVFTAAEYADRVRALVDSVLAT